MIKAKPRVCSVFKTSGLLLALATVMLQLAVFLQPLLPAQYQVAPVCEKISQNLLQNHTEHHMSAMTTDAHAHHAFNLQQVHQHDQHHQCQYCVVYAYLIMPPETGIKEVLIRIRVRLLAFQQQFQPIYFYLQRLYLLPQGRAPPYF